MLILGNIQLRHKCILEDSLVADLCWVFCRMSFYALAFVIEMVTYVKDLFEDYFVMGCDV